MATTITNAFVKQYEREFKEEFQRTGAYLRPTVRVQNGVVGADTTFQRIGKAVATTKARHGQITPSNQTHTAVTCSLTDYYSGDWVDKLDLLKVNIDERRAVERGGAQALGRKLDDLIITQLDTTAQPIIAWNVTNSANVRNSLLQMVEALDNNDVPNDGMRFGVLTPRAWAMAMTVQEFSNADYVGPGDLPFVVGAPIGAAQFKRFLGTWWMQHSGLPGKGTAAAKVFVWHKDAVGLAIGDDVMADITWHGDRAAWFINHSMSAGACLIEDAGVIEGNLDDTANIPTS